MKCAYRVNCFDFLAPFTIFPDSLNVWNIYTEMTTAHQWFLCPETISVLICMFGFIIMLTYLSVAKPGRGKPFFFGLPEWMIHHIWQFQQISKKWLQFQLYRNSSDACSSGIQGHSQEGPLSCKPSKNSSLFWRKCLIQTCQIQILPGPHQYFCESLKGHNLKVIHF